MGWLGAQVLARLRHERLLADNVILAGGTISAGVLGFAFQALVSHRLSPGEYGAAFAVFTILGLIGLPASGLTLVIAREASRDRATGQSHRSAALLRAANRWSMIGGGGLAVAIGLASPWIGSLLNIPVPLLLAAVASLPFAIAIPLFAGHLQGQQRFSALSLLLVGQAALKLIGAALLGALLGVFGVIAGITLATALIYFILRRSHRQLLGVPRRAEYAPALRYWALILPSTLAQSVIFSADILLVRHFFSGQAAGEYSAVAALGRAIFWGATSVAAVLFPKVIFQESRGRSGIRIVVTSLGFVAVGGAASLAILSLVARQVLTAFAGSAYANGAAILPLYAIAMTLLGGASVLIAAHQSRSRPTFLSVLLPVTAAEPILILAFHASLVQVVWMVTLSMAVLVAGLAIITLGKSTPRASADDPLPMVLVAETPA